MVTYVNIWDMICFEWQNPLWSIVPKFANKYNFFSVTKDEYFKRACNCPVKMTIESNKPPQDLLDTLAPSAENFKTGDDLLEIEQVLGKIRWTTWIQGLDSDHVKIWYHFPLRNRLQYPYFLYPDQPICFQVIEHIIEYKLLEQETVILHAGAWSDEKGGTLISGRGGVRKTSYLMQRLNAGGKYLADDLVILRNGEMYAYPLCDIYFDYLYLKENNEDINFLSKIKAFKHLFSAKPISFPVIKSSKVDQVSLMVNWKEGRNTELAKTGVVDAAAIDKILAVNRLEMLNYRNLEETNGHLILHLNQVSGQDNWNNYWTKHRKVLSDSLEGLPYTEVYSGNNISMDLFL